MKKFVTDFDMFGHTIHLNFARQGENRNTILGGFFSMIIKCALSAYVILQFKKMIRYEDDTIYFGMDSVDLEEEPPISYNQTNNLIIWSLRKTRTGNKPFFIKKNENQS